MNMDLIDALKTEDLSVIDNYLFLYFPNQVDHHFFFHQILLKMVRLNFQSAVFLFVLDRTGVNIFVILDKLIDQALNYHRYDILSALKKFYSTSQIEYILKHSTDKTLNNLLQSLLSRYYFEQYLLHKPMSELVTHI